VAAAQALPWFAHLIGLPGPVLLPMHLAAILAGLALGPTAGLLNGLAAPTVSVLLTGLPPPALVPIMTVEVATYGAVAGWLAHRTAWRGAWIVLATLGAGRLATLAVVGIGSSVFGLTMLSPSTVMRAWVVGWPGIALQVLALSLVARRLAPLAQR
jgi:hypothetical protein